MAGIAEAIVLGNKLWPISSLLPQATPINISLNFVFDDLKFLFEEFINEEYFLTQEQEDHFLQIQKEIKQGNKKFLILGVAGSGKTLLTYHIASKLIQEKRISTYRVSKDTGISQQTFSDWKNGKSQPKLDKLQKIADYFGVSVEYFTDKNGQKNIPSKNERDFVTDFVNGFFIDQLLPYIFKSFFRFGYQFFKFFHFAIEVV